MWPETETCWKKMYLIPRSSISLRISRIRASRWGSFRACSRVGNGSAIGPFASTRWTWVGPDSTTAMSRLLFRVRSCEPGLRPKARSRRSHYLDLAIALQNDARQRLRECVGPELGDVDPAHEAGAVLGQDVLDEAPERRCPVRLAGPAGVDPDGHHPAAVPTLRLLDEIVEAEPQVLEEVVRGAVGRRDQVAVVVEHLR